MSCCTGKTVDLPRQTPDCKATEQGLCVLFFKKGDDPELFVVISR